MAMAATAAWRQRRVWVWGGVWCVWVWGGVWCVVCGVWCGVWWVVRVVGRQRRGSSDSDSGVAATVWRQRRAVCAVCSEWVAPSTATRTTARRQAMHAMGAQHNTAHTRTHTRRGVKSASLHTRTLTHTVTVTHTQPHTVTHTHTHTHTRTHAAHHTRTYCSASSRSGSVPHRTMGESTTLPRYMSLKVPWHAIVGGVCRPCARNNSSNNKHSTPTARCRAVPYPARMMAAIYSTKVYSSAGVGQEEARVFHSQESHCGPALCCR